jgi:hypothetical protein
LNHPHPHFIGRNRRTNVESREQELTANSQDIGGADRADEEQQDALEIAASTALTDTSVPDEQVPQIPGDIGIAIGSEAATIRRNEALATEREEGAGGAQSHDGTRAKRSGVRRNRRGPLRRR